MQDNSLFNPTETHTMLREEVRQFVHSHEMDKQAEHFDQEEKLNLALFKEVGEQGWLGVTIPEEFGGMGLDTTAAVIIHQELSKSVPGFCLAYLAHSMLFVNYFFHCSNDEQKERILERVLTGEWIAGMAMTEPDYGTDVLGMSTTAFKVDDTYVLNGTKT